MPRRAHALLVAATLALLLAGCADGTSLPVDASEPHDAGPRVCAGLLPTEEVTALLLADDKPAQVREEQQPQDRYPVLSCKVTAGGRTFAGSAYLFNMAGADLVQLPALTPATSVGLTGENVNGMAGADDAWLIQTCRVDGVDDPVPLLVRSRLFSETGADRGPDRREELANLTAALAAGVARAGGCDQPTPVITEKPEKPNTLRPMIDPLHSEVCDAFGSELLGDAAAGPKRDRWTLLSQTDTPSLTRACDLYLDGRRVLSFQLAFGWIAPWAERPGQRGALTQQLRVPGVPGPDPVAAGTVIGAVNGSVLQDGAPVAVAYRLIRHDGQDTPGTFLGVSTEKLFRGWVEGLTSPVGGWDNYLPIPLDAEWTVG